MGSLLLVVDRGSLLIMIKRFLLKTRDTIVLLKTSDALLAVVVLLKTKNKTGSLLLVVDRGPLCFMLRYSNGFSRPSPHPSFLSISFSGLWSSSSCLKHTRSFHCPFLASRCGIRTDFHVPR